MHCKTGLYNKKMIIVWKIEKIKLPLSSQKRFLGRVARHRSAKPSTAVRIRQEPQIKSLRLQITAT